MQFPAGPLLFLVFCFKSGNAVSDMDKFCEEMNTTAGMSTARLDTTVSCIITVTSGSTLTANSAWNKCQSLLTNPNFINTTLKARFYRPRALPPYYEDWLKAKALIGAQTLWIGLRLISGVPYKYCEPCGSSGKYHAIANDEMAAAGVTWGGGTADTYCLRFAGSTQTLWKGFCSGTKFHYPICEVYQPCPVINRTVALNVTYDEANRQIGETATITCEYEDPFEIKCGPDSQWIWDRPVPDCFKPFTNAMFKNTEAVLEVGVEGWSEYGNFTLDYGRLTILRCASKCLRDKLCWAANMGSDPIPRL